MSGAGDDLCNCSRLGGSEGRWENPSPLRDLRMDDHGEVCGVCLAFLVFLKKDASTGWLLRLETGGWVGRKTPGSACGDGDGLKSFVGTEGIYTKPERSKN